MAIVSIELRERFVGCLLGCAVGDALGAPFEGYWGHLLLSQEALLADFSEFDGYPRGQFTDDTQLTVATVESLLRMRSPVPEDIARSIARLWKTQSVIGPGGSCSFAANAFLRTGDWTRCGAPSGQAGNGTAMRTAALGLYFIGRPDDLPAAVAEIARITHQDARSVAGGVAIAKAAYWLATTDTLDANSFCDSVADACDGLEPTFAFLIRGLPALLSRQHDQALATIAWAGSARPEFDRPIITPFVVPTVLASLWAVLRHPDSWSQAVGEAIGFGGDVDTLGALVGTRLGIDAIPAHLADGVVD